MLLCPQIQEGQPFTHEKEERLLKPKEVETGGQLGKWVKGGGGSADLNGRGQESVGKEGLSWRGAVVTSRFVSYERGKKGTHESLLIQQL